MTLGLTPVRGQGSDISFALGLGGPVEFSLIELFHGDIDTRHELRSLVLTSLFLDARVSPDEELPDDSGHLGGWWAQGLGEEPDGGWGSKLWLLESAPNTDETENRARDYASEALAWMVPAGLASGVFVETARRGDILAIEVVLRRGVGSDYRLDVSNLWDALSLVRAL